MVRISGDAMVNGKYPLPDKPGVGFELTEDALKKYPRFPAGNYLSALEWTPS